MWFVSAGGNPAHTISVLCCVLCREYTFNATGSTIGDYTAYVSLTKPDSNPANDADDAPINVVGTRDVAVNITATPFSQVVGSTFAYTVNM